MSANLRRILAQTPVSELRAELQRRGEVIPDSAEVERLLAELKARDRIDRLTKTYVDQLDAEFHALQANLTTALADVERLTRERDELRRANEGLRADATRLDWIEANAAVDQWNHSVGAVTTVFSRRISPRPIRETIDAVMRGKADG